MEIVKDSSPGKRLRHGHTVVGVVRTKLCEGFPTDRGIIIRAPGSSDPVPNTKPVWVGGPNVTADNSGTGGYPLMPGNAIGLPIDDPASIYVISSDVNQDVSWIGI